MELEGLKVGAIWTFNRRLSIEVSVSISDDGVTCVCDLCYFVSRCAVLTDSGLATVLQAAVVG